MDRPVPLSPVETAWRRVAAHLESERLRVSDEIRNYPRPIAGCDVQFNHALERRAGIVQDLARLHALAGAAPAGEDPLAFLKAFLDSSTSLGERAKQELTSDLDQGLAGP
jgi:hypothetical protein